MDMLEAMSLLEGQLRPYAARSFADLAALVGHEEHLELAGASGASYQSEISVFWDSEAGGNIRVMASIDDGGLRAFVPLTTSILMAPDGRLIV